MQDIMLAVVPSDHLLPTTHAFPGVSPAKVGDLFVLAHAHSEAIYNGNGSWGHGFVHDDSSARWRAQFARPEDYVDWPTLRDTARRLAGYAWALDVQPNDIYRDRLAAGVDWLLDQQFPDGSFPWWVSRTGMPNTDHLFYVNGYAAVGLMAAYCHLKDERIPASVQRAADWTARFPTSTNNNYNSLACWVLAASYHHDAQPAYLEAAVQKTVEGVLPRQLANGGWAGHNSWVYYQGIIVAGLATLLGVLPSSHPYHERLWSCFYRTANNLTLRQGEQGALLATFDPQEREEARRRRVGYELNPEFLADPHTLLGLLWAYDLLGMDLRSMILGLLNAYIEEMCRRGPEQEHDSHGTDMMTLGYAWHWLARLDL